MAENGPRLPVSGGGRIIPGVYDIENFYFSVRPCSPNTVPTDTYRGAGRPEANFLMERLMDKAAEVTGLSREDVRRRNLIRPEQMPYRTQMGMLIELGDFAANMKMAMDAADWENFPKRRAESEKRGKLRGIGLSNFVEASGGRPTKKCAFASMRTARRRSSPARIRTGRDTKRLGAIARDVPRHPVRGRDAGAGRHRDHAEGAAGTFGSRSSWMGGVGLQRSAKRIVEKRHEDRRETSMQAEPRTCRSKRACSAPARRASPSRKWRKPLTSRRACRTASKPGSMRAISSSATRRSSTIRTARMSARSRSMPISARSRSSNYVAVDDCGVVLNPFIVHGQVYGGVAQGIGQALTSRHVYDAEGQLVTGSFMDYGMPRAQQLSMIDALFNETPCKDERPRREGRGRGRRLRRAGLFRLRRDGRAGAVRRQAHRHAAHARPRLARHS